jgi:carbon monoxide dehydrogenase subunit G
MARSEFSVEIPRPASEVFPWLLDADKVPRWTNGLESYEPAGPIGRGTHIRQTLTVSGQRFSFDAEVVRHEPPTVAETRFEAQGIDVRSAYRLAEADSQTTLTQAIEAKAGGIKARLLLPMFQPHLERKLRADLEKLRELLAVS